MRKIFTLLLLAVTAAASSWAVAPKLRLAGGNPDFKLIAVEKPALPSKVAARADSASASWGEWRECGTASFLPGFKDRIKQILSYSGTQWVEFDEPFRVERRESTDGIHGQFRFMNVFNHRDIIVDYNSETCAAEIKRQSIGIAQHDYQSDDAYAEFHLVAGGYYFASTGTFEWTYCMLLVTPNLGYEVSAWYMNFTGFQSGYVSMGHPDIETVGMYYVGTSQNELLMDVEMGPGVTGYRLVPDAMYLDGATISKLYTKNPGDSINFQDLTSTTLTLPIEKLHTSYGLIPLGADGKAAGKMGIREFFRNLAPEGNWVSMGQGKIKERLYVELDLSDERREQYRDSTANYYFPLMEYAVEVERDADTPGRYRLKNPFANHPWASELAHYVDGEDYYILIDATDPSKVLVPYSTLGVKRRGWIANKPVVCSEAWYGESMGNGVWPGLYGKFADNRISMPPRSMYPSTHYLYRGDYPDNDLEIELPGYVDYTMEWGGEPTLNDEGASVALGNISSAIASVDYALVSNDVVEANRVFPERITAMVASRDSSLTVYTATISGSGVTLTVPAEEVPYGRSHFVAVPRDANGEAHSGIFTEATINKMRPVNDWKSLGKATLTQSVFNCLFTTTLGNPPAETEVEVKESPDTPGLYYLVEPWKAFDISFEGNAGAYNPDHASQMFINASDPNGVYITADISGAPMHGDCDINTGVRPVSNYGDVFLGNLSSIAGYEYSFGNVEYNENNERVINLDGKVLSYLVDPSQNNEILGPVQGSKFSLAFTGEGWSEWQEYGTASFPADFKNTVKSIVTTNMSEWVEFDEPFKVEMREKEDGANYQFRLVNVFNHRNIIIDFNYDTGVATIDFKSIGIAQANPYDESFGAEYRLNARGRFFDQTGTFEWGNCMLMVSKNSGYNLGGWSLTLDGYQRGYVDFMRMDYSEKGPYFVGASQNEVTFEVEKGPGVVAYRVVSDVDNLSADAIAKLYTDNPGDSIQYTDFKGDTFNVSVPKQRNSFAILPLTTDGSAIGLAKSFVLYRNLAPEGNWVSMGQGKIRERLYANLAFSDERREQYRESDGSYTFPRMEYPVEVERDADTPGRYRLKNPFAGHPWAAEFQHLGQNEDSYILIDATDPSIVNIPVTVLEYKLAEWNTEEPLIYSLDWDQPYTGGWCGKFADNRVIMPANIMRPASWYGHNGLYPENDLEIEFPGYVDYSMEWHDEGVPAITEEAATIDMGEIAPSVASIDYALVPAAVVEENLYFPERVTAMVASHDPSLTVYTANFSRAGVTLTIPAEEVPYGDRYFVAVPRDAKGEAHSGIISAAPISKTRPLEEWTEICTATFEHNAIYCMFGITDPYTFDVAVRENPEKPGLYYLVNPWAGYGENYNPELASPLFINATNPERVFITSNLSGEPTPGDRDINTGVRPSSNYGEVYIGNLYDTAGFMAEHNTGKVVRNEYNEKVINLDGAVLSYIMDPSENNAITGYWQGDRFRIVLNGVTEGDSSVEVVEEEATDAPVEYYNLQGVRVANPGTGIYIRRQGSTVTKVIL
ncbi:MAG: hypothetical protein NC210_08055 [[Clostridium] fimetarium]|nr:hypothetical protein [Alistipes timonensis]MCM1406357.1 hypothetical protein [[Clostridium] fimetarium]